MDSSSNERIVIQKSCVETEIVEAALSRHPDVKECAVIASRDDDRQLIAFFTSDSSISTLTLRSYLQKCLQDYMIPHQFICLEALPRTSDGKPDNELLLAMAEDSRASGRLSETLSTSSEKAIGEIWRSVLGATKIGVRDTFFDLGGTSFQALVVIEKMEELLGIRMSLPDLFTRSLGQIAISCGDEIIDKNTNCDTIYNSLTDTPCECD